MIPIAWRPTYRQTLIISILLLLIPIAIIEYQVLEYTHGTFVSPQDDAYTRMAIAKNFFFNHVWGISQYEFSPASSSILYPVVLGVIFMIFGNHLIISFIVNLIAAILLIIVVQKWLQRQGVNPLGQLGTLVALIFLTPLPIMVVIGMEHVLQILIGFLFMTRFCEWLSGESEPGQQKGKLPLSIFIYGILVTGIRYEGLFLVMIACLFLSIRRRPILSLTLGLVSILPIALFGIYSLSKGGYFLPNSIMIRALPVPLNKDAIYDFFGKPIVDRLLYPFPSRGAVAAERILIILPLVYWFFIRAMRQNRLYRFYLFFCLGIAGLHLIFANALFFYRYEAYLIAAAIPVTGLLLSKYGGALRPKRGATAYWVAAWTGIFLLFPLLYRSWESYKETGTGCVNMYEQDYLAAGFLHKYYNTASLIIDDLGAVSYLTEGRKLDLNVGIGNMEVARSREDQYYRPDYLDYLVKREGPSIAIVLEGKYSPWLLEKWQKVGSFHTYNTGLQGVRFIYFYAVDKTAAPELRKNLAAYQPFLPAGVKADFY